MQTFTFQKDPFYLWNEKTELASILRKQTTFPNSDKTVNSDWNHLCHLLTAKPVSGQIYLNVSYECSEFVSNLLQPAEFSGIYYPTYYFWSAPVSRHT